MPLNIVIAIPPLRGKVSFYPPFGALSIIAAAEKDGHQADLVDLDAKRCSYDEAVDRILAHSPDIVGISAIVSTSYGYVKRLSALIKQKMPEVTVVVGGGLSAAGDTVLNNTAVDILVHGEGEITFRELLTRIEGKEGYQGVDGISFRQNGTIIKNRPRELITDLDTLPFPDYDRLDLTKYILNIHEFVKNHAEPDKVDKRLIDSKRSSNFMRMVTSRGCIGKCTFCYRHMPGLRTHSFEYIGDLIQYVKERYNLGHISFGDESFGPSKKWLWGFIDMLQRRKFDLTYHIVGMRVDMVDLDILKALKELGVWHIQFGFESGSQKILNIMEKNTTVEQNIRVVQMLEKVGINTVPFIIIGYPGETTETIYETVDFLKRADLISMRFRPVFPLAMPGAPLYEYAKLKGYITDEDRYLEAISDVDAGELSEKNYFINYTDSPTSVVMDWMRLLMEENKRYIRRRSKAELFRRLIEVTKERGISKTSLALSNKLTERLRVKRLKKGYLQKMQDLHVQSLGADSDSTEIKPEGESLRIVNQRLKRRNYESTKADCSYAGL